MKKPSHGTHQSNLDGKGWTSRWGLPGVVGNACLGLDRTGDCTSTLGLHTQRPHLQVPLLVAVISS